jgi:antitoxin (DNA-binding transcriptional repressor) of toxin-antitoxin stability system
MKATFVDLRTKSAEIIRALLRKERVTVLYRGKPAAVMQPIDDHSDGTTPSAKDHPAFGMWADRDDLDDVAAHVRRLRRSRLDAL